MTLPVIVPNPYLGTALDFLKTKSDREGAIRAYPITVAIPSGTVIGSYVGIIPFNYGFNLNDLYFFFPAMGTGVICNIGYIYNLNTQFTNKTTAFISASTVPAAGGVISAATTLDLCTWRAAGDGWIVIDIEGATTTNSVTVGANLSGAYDLSSLTN